MSNDQIIIHLKHEFALIKNEEIDNKLGWKTWYSLNKDKYKFLYHIALAILSLAPSEAAGNYENDDTYTIIIII
jgi:hypothetical protein